MIPDARHIQGLYEPRCHDWFIKFDQVLRRKTLLEQQDIGCTALPCLALHILSCSFQLGGKWKQHELSGQHTFSLGMYTPTGVARGELHEQLRPNHLQQLRGQRRI